MAIKTALEIFKSLAVLYEVLMANKVIGEKKS